MQNLKIYIGTREGGFKNTCKAFFFAKHANSTPLKPFLLGFVGAFFVSLGMVFSAGRRRGVGGWKPYCRKIAVVGERRKPGIIIITITSRLLSIE